jgi:hypothetical protein
MAPRFGKETPAMGDHIENLVNVPWEWAQQCRSCYNEVDMNDRFCRYCGQNLALTEAAVVKSASVFRPLLATMIAGTLSVGPILLLCYLKL